MKKRQEVQIKLLKFTIELSNGDYLKMIVKTEDIYQIIFLIFSNSQILYLNQWAKSSKEKLKKKFYLLINHNQHPSQIYLKMMIVIILKLNSQIKPLQYLNKKYKHKLSLSLNLNLNLINLNKIQAKTINRNLKLNPFILNH